MNVRCRIVGLPIWFVRSVVEVKSNIEVINYLKVTQYREVQTISFENFYEIFFDSFSFGTADIFEDRKSIVSIEADVFSVVF